MSWRVVLVRACVIICMGFRNYKPCSVRVIQRDKKRNSVREIVLLNVRRK